MVAAGSGEAHAPVATAGQPAQRRTPRCCPLDLSPTVGARKQIPLPERPAAGTMAKTSTYLPGIALGALPSGPLT